MSCLDIPLAIQFRTSVTAMRLPLNRSAEPNMKNDFNAFRDVDQTKIVNPVQGALMYSQDCVLKQLWIVRIKKITVVFQR